ncbi:MAG: 5-(carboxyamino)imidazole ribonucleotide synthase [Fimbriimonadaceae bacterium]
MTHFDLGFLGGGQLARMSIQAAQRMGLSCLSLDPDPDSPAGQIAPSVVGKLGDPQAVRQLFDRCDRVTLENEFIPAESIESCPDHVHKMLPSMEVLRVIQDKLAQRQAFARCRVPSPRAEAFTGEIPEGFQLPAMLKARFGGYDGKGTLTVRTLADIEAARPRWEGGWWLIEDHVPFARELAVMVYRTRGDTGTFPTVETVHVNHVCDLVRPCLADASAIAIAAVEAIGGYGLFGVELFETHGGEILVNEIAPRPHNSGHYTLDWGGVSQFDQHVRLVAGLPLVKPEGFDVAMINLFGIENAGDWRDGLRAALEDPAVRVHWYGKREPRPGRKMGHINVVEGPLRQRAETARARFYQAWTASARATH